MSSQFYLNAAILGGFLLIYSAIAARIDRSWVSGPMVFVAGGLILGPAGLDLLHVGVRAPELRVLAELTLAMVLFTDAAHADLGQLRGSIGLPGRLLLIGLPLTVILGFIAAAVLFPSFTIVEMALLAAILAPTDAALGKPVVTSPTVPGAIREALNFESGLNDGICVPIVLILIGVAVGTAIDGNPLGHVARVVVEEIGLGVAVGVALTLLASGLLQIAERVGSIGHHWRGPSLIGLAAACFAGAQAAGGSGFIACFTGGLLFGALNDKERKADLAGAESTGDVLAMLTWVVFSAAAFGLLMAGRVTWAVVLYSALSLTVVRMLPVFISLFHSGLKPRDKLFIGWFGPRGLASVVFGILILDARLPDGGLVETTIVCTILLSVVAHGASANPLIAALGNAWQSPKGDVPGRAP